MECLDNVQSLYEKSADFDEGYRVVNQFYIRLGRAYMNALNFPEAEKYLKRGIAVAAEAIERSPGNMQLITAMAVTEKMYGMLLTRQGRFDEAIETFGHAVERAESLESADSSNITLRAETANIRCLRASTLDAVRRHEEAVEDYEYAISVYEEKIALAPDEIGNYRTLMQMLSPMIDCLNRLHRFKESRSVALRIQSVLGNNKSLNLPVDQQLAWVADTTLGTLDVIAGKALDDPSADARAIGLFSIAYVFSKENAGDEFDDASVKLIRVLEPDSEFRTVSELFQYAKKLPLQHPGVVAMFPLLEARIYARQAELLSQLKDRADVGSVRMNGLKKQSIDLLVKLVESNPIMLNQIYLEPDLIWLRRTDLFADRGLTLDGADR
jgi:tetratricopeptide (TPR) repeat protein